MTHPFSVEAKTTRIDSEAGSVSTALVRALGTPCQPLVYRLGSEPCIVGSGDGADLVIDDPTVSRRHVSLKLVPTGVLVEDLGSTNGTRYLGQGLEKMVVALGSCIDVGTVRIELEADDASQRTSASDSVELLAPEECSRLAQEYALIAESASMKRVIAVIHRLRQSKASVLVSGESGVGKELVARAVHRSSEVSRGPFVALNCGAIARDVLASELFGHVRGAFTGASDARRGAFAAADGGTLFLDEVGELPLDVQPALLRALESGEVRPVGADRSTQVNVRIVAATNRDLRAEVKAGLFREDLYYRLAVVSIAIAPLRTRPEDIEPLASLFARGHGLQPLPRAVIEQLKAHRWPGNARELRNAISTYAALGVLGLEAPDAGSRHVLHIDLVRPYVEQRDELCDSFTKSYLLELLARSEGNLSQAARIAKLDRSYLSRLLVRAGITTRQSARS